MKLSQKIQEMELSPIRKFVPYADQARAAGKKVYGLNIGQPDIKTPRAFFDAIRDFDQEVLAYANSQGIPELLEALVGAHLPQVLAAHVGQRGVGEVGDALLRAGAILEHQRGVGHVDLAGELVDLGLLFGREGGFGAGLLFLGGGQRDGGLGRGGGLKGHGDFRFCAQCQFDVSHGVAPPFLI